MPAARYGLPSQETLLRLLEYNPETGEFWWKARLPTDFSGLARVAERKARSFNARWAGKRAFTALNSANGSRQAVIQQQAFSAHRVAWKLVYDEEPEEVTAKNGDLSDCRIENLEATTRTRSGRNTTMFRNNTSGVRGVTWSKAKNRWFAHIKVNRRLRSLGYYTALEDAARARHTAEAELGFIGSVRSV